MTFYSSLLSAQMVALDVGIYQKLWEKHDVLPHTLMSQGSLLNSGKALVGYFKGFLESPNLILEIGGEERPLYNQRELAHLLDVKDIVRNGLLLKKIAGSVLFLSLVALYWKHKKGALFLLGKGLMASSLLTLISTGLLSLPFFLDFGNWWTKFHLLAFKNDLWILDPRRDWLIRIFPEEFFLNAIYEIVYRLFFMLAGTFFLGFLINRFSPKDRP